MRKYLLFTAFTLFTGLAAFAQDKWNIDPAHTDVNFKVKHLGINYVEGNFTKFSGTITAPKADFQDANIDVTVDVNSIRTDVEPRDKHLKSDDFFQADKYPEMKLKSVSFKKVKGNKYALTADLTIRETTKRVVFDVTYNGTITDPWGKQRAGFTGSANINRLDFGVKYADKLPSGVYAVAPTVDIILNVEAVKE